MLSKEYLMITVNNNSYQVAAGQQSLMSYLREELGLTGAKPGCETGHCGACTVIVEGKAVRSCSYKLSRANGKKVETIEGLAPAGGLHPLQYAFVKSGAVQCGYCTPGMIMAAKALLDSNPDPSQEEIIRALDHNYCRCTGYLKIIAAIQQAARLMCSGADLNSNMIDPEDLVKVTGGIKYAADHYNPEYYHAKMVTSSQVYARILAIDTSQAASLPGVTVLTASDVPGSNFMGRAIPDQPVLADQIVRYWGEPVAVVVAPTPELAQQAVKLVQVTYQPLEPVMHPLEAIRAGAPLLHYPGNGDNICGQEFVIKGDINEGFAQADYLVEQDYSTPSNEHAYLETEAGLAYWDDDGRFVLRACSQGPHEHQKILASFLNLPLDKVRVIQTPTGGGFGGKCEFGFWCMLALAAYCTNKPVKMVLSREESFLMTAKRHPCYIKCRSGVNREGKVTALEMEIIADTGAYASRGPIVIKRSVIHAAGPYAIPHVRISAKAVYTNNTYCGAVRGFGVPQVAFAIEAQMDIMARQVGIDPLEFRRINGLSEGKTASTGEEIQGDLGFIHVLDRLSQEAMPEAIQFKQTGLAGGRRRGIGIAAGWMGPGKIGEDNRAEAWIELLESGRFRVLCGSVDIGQGSNQLLRLIASRELNQPVENIEFINGDSLLTPDADKTCASRVTYYSGNAVLQAARKIRQAVTERAAVMLGIEAPMQLVSGGVEGGNYFVDLAKIAKQGKLWEQGVFRLEGMQPLSPQGQGKAYETYATIAVILGIEIDEQNDLIEVKQAWLATNVGKALIPLKVEGQLEGGVVWGIGFALHEKFVMGQTSGFKQYRIPIARDMPVVKHYIVEIPHGSGPYGALGIGEVGMFPIAPAIANAVADATGERLAHLPLALKISVRE